jgi:hypothetical protein
MGQQLSAALELHGSNGSASICTPSNVDDIGTRPSRTSAEIVPIGKTCLPKLRRSVREDFKEMFWHAFDATSLHGKCTQAAGIIRGVSPDTFARIYNDDTAKVDMALALFVAAAYQERHKAFPAQFAGLIVRATTGAIA